MSTKENNLKEKAQEGQRLITEAILEIFKKELPPDREGWTAGPITEKLGLYEGYTKTEKKAGIIGLLKVFCVSFANKGV